jgi:hypothetical protein
MIPPLTSNTMNNETLAAVASGDVGRPEKSDSEKSDKTIANQESATE